jgi:hypothetical protein
MLHCNIASESSRVDRRLAETPCDVADVAFFEGFLHRDMRQSPTRMPAICVGGFFTMVWY